MPLIHPSAIVHQSAEISDDVKIGPNAIIGPNVSIGGGTVIEANVYIDENTILGEDNHVFMGSILGTPPQDRKYKAERTYLKIGSHNLIREYVTIHRASGDGESTEIGDNNFLMATVHVGHNAKLGNNIVISNGVGISGHSIVEDNVNFGGMTGVHQFVRVGKYAMIGGMSRITRDVPPFMIVGGNPAEVRGINAIGLRRAGLSQDARVALQTACRLLFKEELNMQIAIEQIRTTVTIYPEVEYLIEFMDKTHEGRMGRQLDRPPGK